MRTKLIVTRLASVKTYSSTAALFTKIVGNGTINWPALALTRFILAFIVLAAHASSYTNNPGPLQWISYFNPFNAIVGFLLISGLSIGNSVSKGTQGYFQRRAQRIYPVYLASMLLAYLIEPTQLTPDFLLTILINIAFLNQLVTFTSYIGPAWTLSLEVWLYSLAPVFLKLSYKQLVAITLLSFACFCIHTCGRTLFHWPYYAGLGYGLNLLLLSFIWIAGFILAIYNDKLKITSLLIGSMFTVYFGLVCAIAISSKIKHHQLGAFFTSDLLELILQGSLLLFVYYVVVSNRRLPRIFSINKNAYTFLGNISYPLYLTHASGLVLCRKMHITNWALIVLVCLTIASLVYWLFDSYSKKRVALPIVGN